MTAFDFQPVAFDKRYWREELPLLIQGYGGYCAVRVLTYHSEDGPDHAIVFYAFDVLHLNGEDLTRLPLAERRARLPEVVKGSGVLISHALPGTAAQVIEAVQRLGLEGVIAKHKNSRYDAGQSGAWVKLNSIVSRSSLSVATAQAQGVDALLVGVG